MNTDKPWLRANQIMLASKFSVELIRQSQIWAAKPQKCPKCEAEPYTPCLNMSELKRKVPRSTISHNRYPHPERIDWNKLEVALRQRGYPK